MSFIKKSFVAAAFIGCMQIAQKVTLGGIFSSFKSYFSLAHCVAPLLGFFSTTSMVYYSFFFRTIVQYLIYTSWSFYLPTLCGTLWLSTESRVFKLVVPAVCIVLFASHPQASLLFSCYWIIPLILSFTPKRWIVLQAVGSTFTTHAVGSVLWIYSHPTDPLFWNALLGRVLFERLNYALILTVSYYGLNALGALINNYLSPSFKRSIA